MGSKAKTRAKKRRPGPETRDKHRLYELAVQSPEVNLGFCDRVYKKKNGVRATSLKEDFCGTALTSAEWVRMRPSNRAIGVDLDGETLRWAKRHNITPLGDAASRVKLVRDDVRTVREPKVDIVIAFNFSYYIFKTFPELCEYFENAKQSLSPNGIFVLDIFGGWEAQMDVTDKTRYNGFTYLWEQKGINPVNHHGRFNIHFKFHGGGGIKKAFAYDWRLWSIPEVRDALQSVGFQTTDVYFEGFDEDGDGNGVFRKVKKFENCPGWNAFIVASQPCSPR